MIFNETRHTVSEQHNHPPISFLTECVLFGRRMLDTGAAVELTAINRQPHDALGQLAPLLGPWRGELGSFEWCAHRLAAILEALRCHAGYEADWKWEEGVDKTNKSSMKNPKREESGIFQVSYDSLALDNTGRLHALLAQRIRPEFTVSEFIRVMKEDKQFALEYAANLYRVTTRWAGPWNRGEVQDSVHRPACEEFLALITAKPEISIATEPRG